MNNKLSQHKKIWKKKPLLRYLYHQWWQMIKADLVKGKTIEIGSGIGAIKEKIPDLITSDIQSHNWLDMRFDAHKIPFKKKELANIIIIDTLHHLSNPIKFLSEAARVLKPGGKLIILEPYPSFISRIVYRLFHPEPFIMNIDYYAKNTIKIKHPWKANQAIAYLIFFKHRKKFNQLLGKQWQVIKKQHISLLLYPLSGGFDHKQLIPNFLLPLILLLEKTLMPFRSLLAFRCYLVLKKR